uniref:Uncharacterized protein n=1 Tax=Arundo donax TaxID=35708 RepID=A0A0A8ZSF9_ARUDO
MCCRLMEKGKHTKFSIAAGEVFQHIR